MHSGNMKHARAIEFDYTNLLAMLLKDVWSKTKYLANQGVFVHHKMLNKNIFAAMLERLARALRSTCKPIPNQRVRLTSLL